MINNEYGLHISSITSPDVNNGIGFRVTVWISGCNHKCLGCQNQWLQNYKQGKSLLEVRQLIMDILDDPNIDGITFSGGDPLYQNSIALEQLAKLLEDIKEQFPNKNIWVYTGFKYENLIYKDIYKNILKYIDVLVDGKYDESLRDITLPYRGSSNQRVIDVQSSIKYKYIVTIKDNVFKNWLF